MRVSTVKISILLLFIIDLNKHATCCDNIAPLRDLDVSTSRRRRKAQPRFKQHSSIVLGGQSSRMYGAGSSFVVRIMSCHTTGRDARHISVDQISLTQKQLLLLSPCQHIFLTSASSGDVLLR